MNKKILVVDDEKVIRNVYKAALADGEISVHEAESGEEAIRKLEGDKFDIMVLDINMPGMNGIEVLRKVKERWKHLPVIISSAYHHYKHEFGIWLSDAYVVKSDDIEELKTIVKELLSRGEK